MLADQSMVEEPERRVFHHRARGHAGPPPDPEVPARHARWRFTTTYKLEILRRADACTRSGELGSLLRKEGLYSSHLTTWRQQRVAGLRSKTRGRKATAVDPRVKKLEQENRRLTSRLAQADAIIAFPKKFPSSWGSP